MKTDLFQSWGHCWVFQICWHIECSTFTASSFRIWNSSTGIPSLLALFVVMLSKVYLTSHSRKSGSRWVIIPSWLSGSWRSFCIVLLYSCHLFLIFCLCYVHTISVLYCAHLCMKCSFGISNFLKEISSLSYSIAFLYFFALITEEGFLVFPCYSSELCIQMGICFLEVSQQAGNLVLIDLAIKSQSVWAICLPAFLAVLVILQKLLNLLFLSEQIVGRVKDVCWLSITL